MVKVTLKEWRLHSLAVIEVDWLPNFFEPFEYDGQLYDIETVEAGVALVLELTKVEGKECKSNDG